MLLIMRNLPSDIKYSDIKSLIQNKCFVGEVILDKLIKDGTTSKQVTIGVAKDEDATRIMHRLNGTYIGGLQIYVETVNKSKGQNDQGGGMDQVGGTQNPNHKPWVVQQAGMHGYGMPAGQPGYQAQQGMNQPGMGQQMGYGYGAWMTSNNTGVPPVAQTNYMGYGNQQGLQGQQSNSSQGQYGGSRSGSQPMGAQKELGFGYSQGNSQNDRERVASNDRGYGTQAPMGAQKELGFRYSQGNSQNDRERVASNDRGYGTQAPMGAQKELGFRYSQGNSQNDRERVASNDRGYGTQASFSGNQDRGRGPQKPPNERGPVSYGSVIFDTDTRFGSGNAQRDSMGYRGQQPSNQRVSRFDSLDSRGNSYSGSGFDTARDGGERKRPHSPEREGRHMGNSRDRFQGGSSRFEGNQGKGFNSNRDSRDNNNRPGPSRDNFSANPAPLLGKTSAPYSWSNNSNTSSRFDNPRPFAGDQSKPFGDTPRLGGGQSGSFGGQQSRPFGGEPPRTFDNKPKPFGGPIHNKNRNETKSKVVWNSKSQPPSHQNSPARGPPEKKPKKEEKPFVSAAETAKDFQKKANRAISWRGEGISAIAKDIVNRTGKNMLIKWTGSQNGMKSLKKILNSRIEELIKEKYPNNPYPQLHGPEIVGLYRARYPVSTDEALCASLPEAKMPEKADQNATYNNVPPPSNLNQMGPPKANVPQPKQSSEIKPFPKSFNKAKMSGVVPPQLSRQPRRPPLMLGPNALKKKAKPYNVEKRLKAEQRQLEKREFLDENLYHCPTPAMEKALNAVLDEITEVFNTAVDEYPNPNKDEKLIGEAIKQKVSPEFRSIMRLHTIKRILNVTKTLKLRIFVTPGKAPKENVEQALKNYGLSNLKSSSQSRTPMYTADVKTFYNFDRLCTTPGIPVQGRNGPAMITAKPLHLTIPFKFRRLLREKQYAELTGDDEDVEDNIKFGNDGKDDDDGDGDDDESGDDDDVVDVTQEDDVIELSGDEKPEAKTEDNGENNVNEENQSEGGKESTVDLTVDEKMSAAIAEQMGDSVVEIDDENIREEDLEDY